MAMTRSTFAGFTTATLALAASQRSLDVTGQNISNINTEGYTRQRLDLASISPTGHGYFQTQTDCRVGQGVEMTGVIRIRDPFIDVQYRTQLAKVGTIDAKDAMLSKVEEVFDETDSSGVRDALNAVISQLNTMSNADSSNQGSSDALVRSAMETLLNIIHEKGQKIQDVQNELVAGLQTADIPNINEYLKSISVLNESIKNTQILGGAALELQDQRDSLIDELATYLPINVTYQDMNLGGGIKVDTLKITFTDATTGAKYTLVDDTKMAEFTMKPEDPDTSAPVTVFLKPVSWQQDGLTIPNPNPDPNNPNGPATNFDPTNPKDYFSNAAVFNITNSISNGVLKGKIDSINKTGIFDLTVNGNVQIEDPANPGTMIDAVDDNGNPIPAYRITESDTKGVGYYKNVFDAFVNNFANTLNKLNQEAGGGPLFDTTDDPPITDSEGNLLFTATSIKVTDAWLKGETKIMTSTDSDINSKPGDPTTANENVLKMIRALTLENVDFNYTPVGEDGKPYKDRDGKDIAIWAFNGNFFDAYDSLQKTQSIERKASQSILSTRTSVLNEIANSKDAVSGVWMDEEVMNLMRYQQSYNAAARLMTTLDDALETLISNTGRVGR